jgi:type IV pilus assembly protein PilE
MAPARHHVGVTLLELLVTLALVGILAALAYPSYRGSLLRAHRIEAIDALLAVAAAQERFHVQHGRYAWRLDDGTDSPEQGLNIAAVTIGGHYQLGLTDATPRAGSGQEADERCSRFSIHANGRRSAADRHGTDTTWHCWG